MKRSASTSNSSGSQSSSVTQPLINIPSSTLSGTVERNSSSVLSNSDLHDSVSLSSDDSCFLPQPLLPLLPLQQKNEIYGSDTDDCVPFTAKSKTVLKEVPCTTQKFKRKKDYEKKVPEAD